MVSIEDKAIYQLRINETPKLAAFNNLLLNKPIILPIEYLNDIDEIYFGIIRAIQTNDKNQFEKLYSKKKNSKPSRESPSPFVNNDFFIFCLIVGIIKFNYDKNWINYIISIRSRNDITITFESIINENYNNKFNLPEVILMFFQLSKKELVNNELLSNAFKSISENTALFTSQNDFQIICAKCAYDLCIILKESPAGSEIRLLQNFNVIFLKRTMILTWIVQTTIMILFLFVLIKFFSYFPKIKSIINYVDPIFGILGIGIIGFFSNFIRIIKKFLFKVLLRIFGYSNELIEKINNKSAPS